MPGAHLTHPTLQVPSPTSKARRCMGLRLAILRRGLLRPPHPRCNCCPAVLMEIWVSCMKRTGHGKLHGVHGAVSRSNPGYNESLKAGGRWAEFEPNQHQLP